MQLMRNILSLGIVCMTIEPGDEQDDTNNSLSVHNTKWIPGIYFPIIKICKNLLPPANEVRREVMFSQVRVSPTFWGGGYPIPGPPDRGDTPSS